MGIAACGWRGFKERTRVSGERPIGAAHCRQQYNQESPLQPPTQPLAGALQPKRSAKRQKVEVAGSSRQASDYTLRTRGRWIGGRARRNDCQWSERNSAPREARIWRTCGRHVLHNKLHSAHAKLALMPHAILHFCCRSRRSAEVLAAVGQCQLCAGVVRKSVFFGAIAVAPIVPAQAMAAIVWRCASFDPPLHRVLALEQHGEGFQAVGQSANCVTAPSFCGSNDRRQARGGGRGNDSCSDSCGGGCSSSGLRAIKGIPQRVRRCLRALQRPVNRTSEQGTSDVLWLVPPLLHKENRVVPRRACASSPE